MNKIYLIENLEKLNQLYGNIGIYFELDNETIRVKEKQKFLLNNYPEIKEKLRKKYHLVFNDRNKWHISRDGVKLLKDKKLKFKPNRDVKILKEILFENIKIIEEKSLKNSLTQLLKENPSFFKTPASKIKHHDYMHGLLDHTIEVLEIALDLSQKFENNTDRDLIVAGSVLHDIGKINCYEQFENDYINITETFLNQEHIVNGIKLVTQLIKSEKLDDLIHIIASHHNLKDWGSPVKPNSKEAWIIHFADGISAKIG